MNLALTHEGDLTFNETGDFRAVSYEDEIAQAIAFHLKTRRGSFSVDPNIGCDLNDLVGELLTRDTLAVGEAMIREALQKSDTLSTLVITVRGVPINTQQALFVVEVGSPTGLHRVYTVPFDFLRGVVDVRTSTAVGVAYQEVIS